MIIGLFPKKEQEEIDNKALKKAKKIKEKGKGKNKYITSSMMKRRVKNSKVLTNIKCIGDDGLIELKNGGYASLIEIKAIDLSLSSNQEKTNFFHMLKRLYQIKGLNLNYLEHIQGK